jgi:hypothetical protein
VKHTIELNAAGTLALGIAVAALGALLLVVQHLERHARDGVPPEFRSVSPRPPWYEERKRDGAWGFVFMGALLVFVAFFARP